MPLDALQSLDIIEVMENFLTRRRPPEHLRQRYDLTYKLDNQQIIIFEIREKFASPGQHTESPIAKVTFVKSSNNWKVYWMRANMKWYAYEPAPVVKSLNDFIKLVEEDKYHCFWG